MNPVLVLQAAVIIVGIIFILILFRDLNKNRDELKGKDRWLNLGLAGIVTQFFDTLGIGSYATLTAWFRITKAVPDKQIPGTLNTCTVVTCLFMTLAYTTAIEVEITTLVTLIIASTIGAYFGAGFVSKLNVTYIRFGMGVALIVVVLVMLSGLLGLMPLGGEAIGLSLGKLVIAAVIAFILGALMTIGIGIYAPMMALVYAMGLSPLVAFPIMMGSCAFLIPAAGIKFIKENKKENITYDKKTSICVNFIGCIGVAAAVFIVKSMPLTILKYLVICVLIYTSIMLLKDALRGKKDTQVNKEDTTPV